MSFVTSPLGIASIISNVKSVKGVLIGFKVWHGVDKALIQDCGTCEVRVRLDLANFEPLVRKCVIAFAMRQMWT